MAQTSVTNGAGMIQAGGEKTQTRADFAAVIRADLFHRLRRLVWHRAADRLVGPGLAMLLIVLTPIIFSLPNMLMVRELNSHDAGRRRLLSLGQTGFWPLCRFHGRLEELGGLLAGCIHLSRCWLPITWATSSRRCAMAPSIGGIEFRAEFLSWIVAIIMIWLISYLQIRGARLSGLFTNWAGRLHSSRWSIMSVIGIVQLVSSAGYTISLPFLPEGESP